MWMYITKRILAFIPTMFIAVTFIFVLTRVIPGDPAWVLVGRQVVSKEKVAEVRKELGLDKPIFVQYMIWLPKVLRGDFGTSIFFRRPVIEIISVKFRVTLSLAALSMLLTFIVALSLGILAANRQNSIVDNITMVFSALGISFPPFWLGFLFILLFAVTLGWFPTSGYRPLSEGFIPWIRHLFLPIVSLSLAQMALLTRMTRSSMLQVLQKEYIVTASAKGLPRWMVIYKHALRNALVPIVTVAGLSWAITLGGSVIIENVFAIPGLGRLIVLAAIRRDYPILQGAMFYLIGTALLVNLLVDISYVLINPKVTYE